jgi:rubrerythrin
MAVRLTPLSVSELCAHALDLERDAALRYGDYARRMDELGEAPLAEVFRELAVEQGKEVGALELATGERKPAELSPWEYAWRLTYLPEGMEHRPRLVPASATEALQLAALAKRRAEAYYVDVSEHAKDVVVRSCAAEMAANAHRQLRRIKDTLGAEVRAEQSKQPATSASSDSLFRS